jgi:hypothetical protein
MGRKPARSSQDLTEIVPKGPNVDAPRTPKQPSKLRERWPRVAIAAVGFIGSITVAFIKGYFDRVHIDKRLDNLHGVAIDSGFWSEGYSDASWTLDKPTVDPNQPPRKARIQIRFGHPFSYPPKVFISVRLIDASNEAPLRYTIEVRDVSKGGFALDLGTQGNSKIFWLAGDYIAFQQ